MASSTQGRIPPQSLESEKALLGAILIKHDTLSEVLDVLPSADAFYAEKNRIIYRAMVALWAKNEPIDIVTLREKLTIDKKLEGIGGATYLAELASEVPAAGNAMSYANIIQDKFLLRSLTQVGETIANLGYQETDEVDSTLEKAEKAVYEVTAKVSSYKFVSMSESLKESKELLAQRHENKDEVRGVRTGFRDLDNLLAGLQKSDLIILAARPSVGKTSLALDIARQTSVKYGTVVGIFSLEMSAQQLVDRMVAAEAHVNSWRLRTGRGLTDNDLENVNAAYERLGKAPIYIDDQPGNNILKMRAVARRLARDAQKKNQELGLIIVDYLQLMVPTETRAADNLVQQVTEISRSLKNLARELNVPVLALSQLSRAVEQRGGKPRLSDLRDSGSIEQDADVVMFIHRDDKANREKSERPNIAEILVQKHRNGPTGEIELYFNDSQTSFTTMEKSDFSALEANPTETPF